MTVRELVSATARKDPDCSLCNEGDIFIGQRSNYGALVVLRTGKDLERDWYATLQPGTLTDPVVGIHCLLMPLGHIGSFAEINRNREFAMNQGLALGRLSYAMQTVLEEGWEKEKGVFVPQQIIYGKHAEGRNTKPGHIHLRFTDHSGCLAQNYPSDNGWRKREIFTDTDGNQFVKASPVSSQRFDAERFARMGARLIEICNNF